MTELMKQSALQINEKNRKFPPGTDKTDFPIFNNGWWLKEQKGRLYENRSSIHNPVAHQPKLCPKCNQIWQWHNILKKNIPVYHTGFTKIGKEVETCPDCEE